MSSEREVALLSGRIPGLDGMRALAVLLVLRGHLQGALGSVPLPQAWAFVPGGDFGVQVFFVISGFLITHLLVGEEERAGKIAWKAFIWRRTLRIWPALYFYIACISIFAFATGAFALKPLNILAAGTFTLNVTPFNEAWQLGHMWSLAVEEQFYLLWPLALIVFGWRRAAMLAAAGVSLIFLFRIFVLLAAPNLPIAGGRRHSSAQML